MGWPAAQEPHQPVQSGVFRSGGLAPRIWFIFRQSSHRTTSWAGSMAVKVFFLISEISIWKNVPRPKYSLLFGIGSVFSNLGRETAGGFSSLGTLPRNRKPFLYCLSPVLHDCSWFLYIINNS